MASKTIKVSMQITAITQPNAASRELAVSFTNGVSKKDDKNKIEKYQYSYWYRKGYTKNDKWIAQGSNIDVPAKNDSNNAKSNAISIAPTNLQLIPFDFIIDIII